MKQKNYDVVIAGAGPVGTVACYRLARMGFSVLLLEAQASCPEDLRASTLHPPSLEMLDELGLTDDLHAQGLKAPVYQYRNRRSGERFAFDLSELSDMTAFPYRLQCEQYKLARMIVTRLEAMPNVDVKFSHRLVGLEQSAKDVTIHVESPLKISTLSAQFLIGCDGANSIVRKWLDIGFEGFTYPEKFVTFSTTRSLENDFEDLALVNYVADPHEWMVLLRVPSVWRVLVPAQNFTDDFLTSNSKKQDVFHRLVGDPTVKTEHRTIYSVHQRVAENYYKGRCILAGDAAHLNNPLGGFGMNSGIHDVWNLTGKLEHVLNGRVPSNIALSQYERQRQAVMRSFVQAQTIRNKKLLENNDEDAQRDHQKHLQEILSDDTKRREYLLGQAMFKSLDVFG